MTKDHLTSDQENTTMNITPMPAGPPVSQAELAARTDASRRAARDAILTAYQTGHAS